MYTSPAFSPITCTPALSAHAQDVKHSIAARKQIQSRRIRIVSLHPTDCAVRVKEFSIPSAQAA